MPVINIQEDEAKRFAAFDATENTVLIPMLYCRSFDSDSTEQIVYTESDDRAIKFTNYSDFITRFSGKVATVEGKNDKTYTMAKDLLLQGLNVVIKPIFFDSAEIVVTPESTQVKNKSIELDEAYAILDGAISNGILDEFKNKNIFNIKFITSGAYANAGKLLEDDETALELVSYKNLQSIAESRGDAIALVELREIFTSEDKLIEQANSVESSNFAAAFFPWCECSTIDGALEMPASYCYLMAYAKSVKKNADWFAAAGVTRGVVPGLVKPLFDVGESLMHILQGDPGFVPTSIMINPVYNAGAYGYKIWGNRVTNGIRYGEQDEYRDFLNVRILVCDIVKQVYHAAIRTTFEPNDDIAWINFKTLVNDQLERMKSGRGISWYKWAKLVTTEKAAIKAVLTIKPIEAVESFDITVVLTEEDATVEE